MGLLCKDLMFQGDYSVPPETSVTTAFKIIKENGVRYLPVVKDGIYLGVFTSPTLIKLLLPQAFTIDLAGKNTDNSLGNLAFYSMDEKNFRERLENLEGEKVIDYLSDKSDIPVTSPDTPIMEGILLLHRYKRHVVLVEEGTNKYVGVLTINSVLDKVFYPN